MHTTDSHFDDKECKALDVKKEVLEILWDDEAWDARIPKVFKSCNTQEVFENNSR